MTQNEQQDDILTTQQASTEETATQQAPTEAEVGISGPATDDAPPSGGQAALPDDLERLKLFATTLRELKDKRSVRELMEHEMLMLLVRTNSSRINEYPLLEQQQRSIIDTLTTRSTQDPLHKFIRDTIDTFLQALTKYAANLAGGTEDENLRKELLNTEVILLKCVQGTVYALGLCMDNMVETLVRAFGEEALAASDAIVESTPQGEAFWAAHIEHFIVKLVADAYKGIMKAEEFSIAKEGSVLIVRYPFDALVKRLCLHPKPLEKTRLQGMLEQESRDFASRKTRKMVQDMLATFASRPEFGLAADDIEFISRILCIDPCAREWDNAQTALITSGADAVDDDEAPSPAVLQAQFLRTQVIGIACSVGIALNLMRQDFLKALTDFSSKEVANVRKMLGDFSLPCLGRALQTLLEYQFLAELRRRAGDDMGKLTFRVRRERRATVSAVEALFDHGLNRIHRNKIWQPEPKRTDMLLFRPQTPAEVEALLRMLQLEPALAREVGKLWAGAPFRIEFNLCVSLDLLSRTTTNLNQRLAELLAKFGITRI